MSAATLPLMHDDAARRLFVDIAASRHVEPERIPSLEAVDNAIEGAAEHWCDVEGVPLRASMPSFDFGGQRWHEIIEAVLERLELDYDEVYEVAP